MSFKHGSKAEVWLDEFDVSTYFRQMDFAADVDTAETTTFKKTWKTHLPGVAGSTLDLEGLYDPSLGAIRDLVPLDAGGILTTGPAGLEAVGDLARLVVVKTVSYAESSALADAVLFNFSVLADGRVGFGVVLAPMAERTTGANGTTHIGPVGGSANGAIAHLHVTALSATDELDVHIEDSANGTDWVDLGGAAFDTADAVGVQRIAIAGTVRRYLRAVWAISGAGDQEATFSAALARL